MKIKKLIQYVLIGIAIITVIGSVGLFVWSETTTYPARDVALTALESTDQVSVTLDKLIVFTPTEQTDTGLIFYPGGLVEPTAYAPILHQITPSFPASDLSLPLWSMVLTGQIKATNREE